MRLKRKPTLWLTALILWHFTGYAQGSSAKPDWESNESITRLPKIELGTWAVPDTVKNQWTDNEGNSTFHRYPPCYLLDLKEGTDVKPGKEYLLKDIAGLFGPQGLLQDKNDNLYRLMHHPLLNGIRIFYEATGGPVDVDFMFGAGGFGNRLCYYYVSPKSDLDKTTLSLAQSLTNRQIPTFCITDQMRTSIHMERYKKENGEWKLQPKGELGNSTLGDKLNSDNNYGGWGDDMISGKSFRLKYFGADYTDLPSDQFPIGTRIYFFLATYDDFTWNGGTGDKPRLPYSIKFSYRALNREFGVQGKWDFEHYDSHKEKYTEHGPGIFASASVNFTYTDSDKGTLENVNFLTWEDWTQPITRPDWPETEPKVGDFDMNDVGFGLYGVNNPLLTTISDAKINLEVIQEVKDFQDGFDSAKGAWKNYFRYKFILKNGEEGNEGEGRQNMVYSRSLHPVTFTCTNPETGEGRFEPSYTWASIRRFTDDSENGEVVKYLVFRKTARYMDPNDPTKEMVPRAEYLNDEKLRYRIEYAMATDFSDEDQDTYLPKIWDGKWSTPEGKTVDYFEHDRGSENDKTPLPLETMTSLYHDATETLNPENKYINKKRFWMRFAFRDGIRVQTNKNTVASPRASFVIEPRGTVSETDLSGADTKHLKSPADLAPIKNRTFFTITYNPKTELYDKEHISALFIVNEKGKRFCKIQHIGNQWVISPESTDDPDNQDRLFEIVRVIDESETCRHIVLKTNLVPEKDFGVMVETARDLYPENKVMTVTRYNTFGVYPVKCSMPSLTFNEVLINPGGRRFTGPDNSAHYVFNSNTEWSLHGVTNPSEAIFSQWRSYNNPSYPWNEATEPYFNILHNNTATTGTIPADNYNSWLEESFDESVNKLIDNHDGSWSNHDILAQNYDGVSELNARYIIRAYLPSSPAILNKDAAGVIRRADAAQTDGYIVLEDQKEASSRQHYVVSGVENVSVDSDVETIYYDLQGQRVANPVVGQIYITVRGSSASKEVY